MCSSDLLLFGSPVYKADIGLANPCNLMNQFLKINLSLPPSISLSYLSLFLLLYLSLLPLSSSFYISLSYLSLPPPSSPLAILHTLRSVLSFPPSQHVLPQPRLRRLPASQRANGGCHLMIPRVYKQNTGVYVCTCTSHRRREKCSCSTQLLCERENVPVLRWHM